MTKTFSITINPSAFKKWDRNTVARFCGFGILCGSYDKLRKDLQKELVQGIFDYLKATALGFEWSSPRFELTKERLNWHIHALITVPENYELTEDSLNGSDVFKLLNDVFSSGQKHPALYATLTMVDKCYWESYQNKDILKYCDLPSDDPEY